MPKPFQTHFCFLLIFLFTLGGCQKNVHQDHAKHPEGMHMNHDFSDAEEWAKRFNNPERDIWQKPEEVIQLMELQPGMMVVDIGAGTGYFLKYLDQAVKPNGVVLALDVEKNLVDYMSRLAKKEGLLTVEAQVIHPNDPSLVQGKIDRILIVNTWHHIEERQAYGEKLFKALKKEGRLLIVDYEPGVEGPGPAQAHRISSSALEKELQSSGFATEILEESLPYQYVISARKKL